MDIFLLTIIGINVLVSFKGFNDMAFFRKYEFHVGSVKAGEQIRILTSGFLHVDIMHLAFNMLTLYFFAPVVSHTLGNMYFLYIYFGSLVAGNLLTLYLHKDDYYYRAVGASGAVTGIIYSSILLYPEMTLALYFFIPIPGYLFGIGYLLYSIYGMRAKNDNIGHTAHFGGAIAGYLMTLLKDPSMLVTNTKMVILLTIPILLLFYLYKNNKL
ncbi:rhomboid family intramembrane serine protease [Flavobacterium sp. NRK F10]|uniref:rhomboid family intramembrane serine protease n=1 Tax=Flavobacterium sp. NRK F10 TaxID=2954931 RepID=UPI0020904811|nr:rhomboid family intramembrane serine protease [Flavobacterium sp. NRK F10]MCO6173673.1 rhomboid family intramembrane serine protease [Flavobacterium sp. NRK F10]